MELKDYTTEELREELKRRIAIAKEQKAKGLKQEEVELIDDETAELELYKQWGYENPLQDYWQDVRERAAIAAMQGMLSNSGLVGTAYLDRAAADYAKTAVDYANALVKLLKETNNEKN